MKNTRIYPVLTAWATGFGSLTFMFLMKGFSFPLVADHIWTLLVLFSFPHFLASYRVFYFNKDMREDYWYYAWVFPGVLLGVLLFALAHSSAVFLEWAAQITFVGLIWHYLRQAYGVSLRYIGKFSPRKRYFKLVTLQVGIDAWLNFQQSHGVQNLFGIYVQTIEVPTDLVTISNGITLLVIVLFLSNLIQFYWKAREVKVLLSAIPLLALWGWFHPYLATPYTLALLPVFHGLQFFVCYFERFSHQGKKFQIIEAAILVASGLIVFYATPFVLSSSFNLFSERHAMAAVLLFMSLHHYAVESVIWKRRKKAVAVQEIESPAFEIERATGT